MIKKCTAIFLFLLMGLATVSVSSGQWELCMEQLADSEESNKEHKEGNKEPKEYTCCHSGNGLSAILSLSRYAAHPTLFFPAPLIYKQTPPPNPAC